MILVTGDVVLDHNVYEGGRLAGDSPPAMVPTIGRFPAAPC